MVCLVFLVSLVYSIIGLIQANSRDRPNRPEQPADSHASRNLAGENFDALLVWYKKRRALQANAQKV